MYRQSVLEREELTAIAAELSRIKLDKETTSSVARKRIGAVLPSDSETVQILQSGSLSQLIQNVCGSDYELSRNVPVEVRVYEMAGSGMEWHVDDILYDPPQLECVLTVENTSDCTTQWWKNKHEMEQVSTNPNSVILLEAGRAKHSVSSLKHGRRVIVKCAYIQKNAHFNSDALVTQFSNKKPNKARRRSKTGKR